MPTGTITVDFGVFPGKSDASVAVTGQAGILSNSLVEAWLYPVATADHSADEHLVETIQVRAGAPTAGVGFTIYAINESQLNEPLEPLRGESPASPMSGRGGIGTRIYGLWTVAWAWS